VKRDAQDLREKKEEWKDKKACASGRKGKKKGDRNAMPAKRVDGLKRKKQQVGGEKKKKKKKRGKKRRGSESNRLSKEGISSKKKNTEPKEEEENRKRREYEGSESGQETRRVREVQRKRAKQPFEIAQKKGAQTQKKGRGGNAHFSCFGRDGVNRKVEARTSGVAPPLQDFPQLWKSRVTHTKKRAPHGKCWTVFRWGGGGEKRKRGTRRVSP